MNISIWLGYLAIIGVGLVIGLIGGGGSILTIPVLVYLFRIEPLAAISYSFFIVGTTSLAGAINKIRHGQFHLSTALWFGIPDILGVIVMRTYLFPPIPGNLFTLGDHIVTKTEAVILLFSLIMIGSAYRMLTADQEENSTLFYAEKSPRTLVILGFFTGCLTGMVGVGGGFLIVPILVLFAKQPIRMAIGTSLLIIAAKSFIGFLTDRIHYTVDYRFIIGLSVLALAGLAAGLRWHHKVQTETMTKGFAWLVLIIGLYILTNEIFF
jgi:uncharacterized protein